MRRGVFSQRPLWWDRVHHRTIIQSTWTGSRRPRPSTTGKSPRQSAFNLWRKLLQRRQKFHHRATRRLKAKSMSTRPSRATATRKRRAKASLKRYRRIRPLCHHRTHTISTKPKISSLLVPERAISDLSISAQNQCPLLSKCSLFKGRLNWFVRYDFRHKLTHRDI